jgi:N-acetylmuramoyl-L-alanine amidase
VKACWWSGAVSAALLGVLIGTIAAQAPAAAPPYTVLARDGRRPLAARLIGGQEMFALDDLARLFELTVREDAAAGGITVSARNQTIVLTPGSSLASSAGRLISLPAPPARDGRAWYVPVDFVARALSPIAATRIELRRPARLILVGDVRVPRIAGRVEPLGTLARLTLDVVPPTAHSVTQEGPRLLLRFDAEALDATLSASPAPDLIQAVRVADATTLAIDLGPRFASFRTSDLPGDRGATRIVIDVIGQTTEAQPAQPQPATPPGAPQEQPPLLDLSPAGGLRTIVIDAGHGGTDNGAKGPSGTLEKTVTLGVARRLKAALEARLGLRVILTRDGDATVGLDERAALANNNKADLFVSLHVNASVRPGTSGAEVFYLSLDEYGDAARQIAGADRDSLPVFGGGSRDIEVVAWEMAQARYIDQSAALAQLVEGALRERVPMSPRAIQQAPFRVLVGANMPAVLVEMAFITNNEQEKTLSSDQFQNSIAQALTDAVTRFRDARGGAARAIAPAGAAR